MEYDPLIKTGAVVLFYVVLFILLVLWVFKKKKQIHFIKDHEIEELREREKELKDEVGDKPNS